MSGERVNQDLRITSGCPSFGYSLETQRCGQTAGLTAVSPQTTQVGQPPIMPTLFESRKPEACRIEKQQYHNPDRIHRPKREPVVNRNAKVCLVAE
jgi:hypothetical protein